jgi:hypothetical protein
MPTPTPEDFDPADVPFWLDMDADVPEMSYAQRQGRQEPAQPQPTNAELALAQLGDDWDTLGGFF